MLNCLFKDYFGFDCPGCGIQRSCIALLNGDLEKSVILFPSLLLYISLLLLLILSTVFKINISYKVFVGIAISALVIQIVYYALRMTNVIYVDCYFNFD